MAKRGQKSTHRVRFEWDNGVKGINTAWSLADAEMKARQLTETAERRDMRVTVTIEAC